LKNTYGLFDLEDDEMANKVEKVKPAKKAEDTAKWARTMTKWLIKFSHRKGARWNVVGFEGKTGSEARGVVDLIAIRKDHRQDTKGLKRGDLFEIILLQIKGGSAPRPTDEDIDRLLKVSRHHRAKAIVLAEWQRGKKLDLSTLKNRKWEPTTPTQIFG
jgi:putative protein kinase ArgK-like GTPase of G3E family